MTDKPVTSFVCGSPKDHKCDNKGPFLYGLSNGEVTDDEARARKEGSSWGSVSCSICGMTAMDRSMWSDW